MTNDFFSHLKSNHEDWLPIEIIEERERIEPLSDEELDEIDHRTSIINWLMISTCILWLINMMFFCLWRHIIPPGISMYLFALSSGSIALWLTKCIFKDNEDVRYTHFMILNASSMVAFGWMILGCWLCPSIFWGDYRFCVEEVYQKDVPHLGKVECLVGNSCATVLSFLGLISLIHLSIKLFHRHYSDLLLIKQIEIQEELSE